jgi:photosystem II stability/assembly factor-like uncharacterized protein
MKATGRYKWAYLSLFRAAFVAGLVVVAGLFSAPVLRAQESTSAPEKLTPQTENVPEAGEKQEEDALFPLKRDQWFLQLRAYPNAKIPVGAYWRAQTQRQELVARHRLAFSALSPIAAAQADPFSGVAWIADGPQPAAAYYGTIPYSGRATSIAVHPTDPNTVYLGTAAGGVWKTTDGGTTWTPLTDQQASLAIGAVAVDPNNPSTVFAGTGEPDFSTDSYYGQGLLKSTDAGATWTLIRTPFTTGDTAPDFTAIAIEPGNSNIVLAANWGGLYRSADGGNTWSGVLTLGGGVTAVMFDVKNASVAYAGIGGSTAPGTVYMSSDAGTTWTSISGSGTGAVPPASAVIRTALAEDSTGKLYAAFANGNFTTPGTLYVTSNSGASWTQLTSPGGLDWYRNAIAVTPANPQVLYAAGATLYESTDGGQTWASDSSGTYYADQHGFAFSGDGTRMYLADDGGVFVTTQPTAANAVFSSLNATLNTMTFYPGFSIAPGQARLLAGSQDHGLNLYTGVLSWPNGEQSGFCGDGGGVYIDPKATYAYAHCQGGPANWVSNASGDTVVNNWTAAQTGISTTDRWPWVADIKGDWNTVSTVYTGTNRLYQSTNNGAAWTAISGDLTAGSATISTIAVAPTDSNTVYTGAWDGTVSVTTNALSGASATWKKLTGVPNRAIGKIIVMPDSAQDVYLTVNGFDTGHVFHSTNGGTTWTDISGDLPNTPADSIAADPSLLNTLYLATDTGAWVTSNGGTNWEPLGTGLPNVVVQDVLLDTTNRRLRVITHGRGAWELALPLAALESSTLSLSFGNVTRGTTSAAQTVTLTNNLNATLTLNSLQITSPFTETTTCGASLAPGATCTVSVVFAPTVVGAALGTLTVTSPANVVTVSLSGTGVGIPIAGLSPPSLAFGNQVAGIASAAQTVQLSNTGDGALANVAISFTGTNPGDFSQTNNCGTSVAAGASCTVSVVFTPQAVGARSATLSIADNAAGAPQTVALTGTGTAPFVLAATGSTASVQAGASATYALTVTAAQGTSLASAVALACSGLPSSSTCSFNPANVASGATTQSIALTVSTTPKSSPAHASLTGRGGISLAALSVLSALLLPRRRRRLGMIAMFAVLCIGIPGCSGGGSGSGGGGGGGGGGSGTPSGNYTITVTASQSTIYQTTQALTLTVQ